MIVISLGWASYPFLVIFKLCQSGTPQILRHTIWRSKLGVEIDSGPGTLC